VAGSIAADSDKLLPMHRVSEIDQKTDNKVQYHSLKQQRAKRSLLDLKRDKPWGLPSKALADFQDTINILVMKFDFQYEEIDDPNTTGRGTMNLARPMETVSDSASYYDSLWHWVDPPPHNNDYFNSHMKALREYYETISQGRITIDWEIWPQELDDTYQLPKAQNEYGICYAGLPGDVAFDTIIFGLEQYFIDCFYVADSVSPEINF